MTRRRQKGFILAAAIAICFAMVVISLIVANQNRAMVGFARNTHAEAQQAEAAYWGFSQLRAYLQGQGPATDLFKAQPSPTPGDVTQATNTTDGSVHMVWKMTVRTSGNITDKHNYAFNQPANAVSGASVPLGHTSALMTNTLNEDTTAGSNRFFMMFSQNFPFALISETTKVEVQSLRSVSDHRAVANTGVMANLYAKYKATVSQRLNGRAYAGTGGNSVNLTGCKGGIAYNGFPTEVKIPQDFNQKLTSFQTTQSVAGLDSNIQNALGAMYSALHQNFQADDTAQTTYHNTVPPSQASGAVSAIISGPITDSVSPANATDVETVKKNSMGNSDYDNPTGTLTLGAALRVPSGAKERLSFSQINSSDCLILEDDAVLRVDGSVQFTRIYLGRRATLNVGGNVQASRLCLTYIPVNDPITSSVLAGGSVSLPQGSTKEELASFNGVSPEKASMPWKNEQYTTWTITRSSGNAVVTTVETWPKNSDILINSFNLRSEAQRTAVITAKLADYLGTASPGAADNTDVPGALVVGNGVDWGTSKLSGLVVSKKHVNGSTLIGAAWATEDVTLGNVSFFPFFTRAFGHTPGSNVTLEANSCYPTAFGKLP